MENDDSKEADDESDALEAGWRALEAGDVGAARLVAATGLGDASTHVDALMLGAACAREAGDVGGALESLERAAKEDPDWCMPELWMAELLAADPDVDSPSLGEALRHARRALDRAEEEDEFLGALICKAGIELDLGRPTEARRTLRALPAAEVPLDDPGATLEIAELLMEAGDAAEARVRMEALTTVEPDLADAWYLFGVSADATGDEEAKRAAWVKTRTLDLAGIEAHSRDRAVDPDGPSRITEMLIAVAEETLASLPADLRALLANVPILVADLPAAADVAAGVDPRVLGLFSGSPHAESGGLSETPTLTEIVLFRRNIERVADDPDILRDEVRTTLLHEAGHFFGLDERALAHLGLD